MSLKPSLAKGTRDFGPEELAKRNYIFDTIKEAFRIFGFLPLETPAFENLSTLTGKYGEEGDRLIFKLLNSGDFLAPVREMNLSQTDASKILPLISEKALRYDLTVPFARYVAMNKDKLAFPFKRYQIQQVWRADRPQKGRYREFTQCDADVVGSSSLLNEAELIHLYNYVFESLNLNVVIHVNNRKILNGIAEVAGALDHLSEITIALDKLDKIGKDAVLNEMREKGLKEEGIRCIEPFFNLPDEQKACIEHLKKALNDSIIGLEGISELEKMLEFIDFLSDTSPLAAEVKIDITLARGLNYYTGTIIEVKAKDMQYGSIGGGGRYDDLTGIFGVSGIPGVGISFGADRIYDVLEEKNLFPNQLSQSSKCLLANFGEEEAFLSIRLLAYLRKNSIAAEFYPDAHKMKKQIDYAVKKGIPYMLIYGTTEANEEKVNIKHLLSGEQSTVEVEKLLTFLKDN
jgi:histidyl-tRNA synthetase